MPIAHPIGTTAGLSDNAAGAIAYITFVPAIFFLLIEPYKKNPYVRFHAWQSIYLAVAAFTINVALGMILAAWLIFSPELLVTLWRLIEMSWLVVWIACVILAAQGKRFALPVIGTMANMQAGG